LTFHSHTASNGSWTALPRRADWFDFGAFEQITGLANALPKREASGGFNHYNPDFIYRYRRLPNPTAEQIV
jgi:hypothetical protein